MLQYLGQLPTFDKFSSYLFYDYKTRMQTSPVYMFLLDYTGFKFCKFNDISVACLNLTAVFFFLFFFFVFKNVAALYQIATT